MARAALVLIVAVLVAVGICVAFAKPTKPSAHKKPHYDLKEAKKLFAKFIKEYGIKIKSKADRDTRFKNFLSNLQFINDENDKDQTHTLDIGPHAHLSYEEFIAGSTGLLPTTKSPGNAKKRSGEEFLANLEAQGTVPASMDWRRRGKVGPVRDQKKCGACWAFSAAGALESQWAIKHGKLPKLSPQNLIDCARPVTHPMNNGSLIVTSTCNGCHGGSSDCAYYYIYKHGGLHTESSYRQKSTKKNPKWFKCRNFKSSIGAKVQSSLYVHVPANEGAIRSFIGLQGPAAISVCASKAWQHYGANVIEPSACACPQNHGVLLIGYGTYRRQPVWIVKNSWGTKWGKHGGYVFLRRGPSTCGIHANVIAPIVA